MWRIVSIQVPTHPIAVHPGVPKCTPLSHAFPNESTLRDFILKHDIIGDPVLGAATTDYDTEVAAGSMRADGLLTLADDRSAVLEVQFGRSDSAHAGQLIAYDAILAPDAAVWAAEMFRPEDLSVIRRLNAIPSGAYYAVELRMYTVPGAAGLLVPHIVEAPIQPFGESTTAKTARDERVAAYWRTIARHAAANPDLSGALAHERTSRQRWIGWSALRGKHVYWRVAVAAHHTRVTVYVDAGAGFNAYNEAVLDRLHERKDAIEGAFGGPLIWKNDTDRRTSVGAQIAGGYDFDPEEAASRVVATVLRLQAAIEPALATLPWAKLDTYLLPGEPQPLFS